MLWYLHDATPVQLSLSSLGVSPHYQPKMPLSSRAISGALHKQLAPLKEKFRTQVYAVITGCFLLALNLLSFFSAFHFIFCVLLFVFLQKGPLRAAWQDSADKKPFEEAAAQVFMPLGVLPWNDHSYFVTQDEEGALEHAATSNLVRDIQPECDLMISFGIGRGASQWATPITTIKHDAGHFDFILLFFLSLSSPFFLLSPRSLSLPLFSLPRFSSLVLPLLFSFFFLLSKHLDLSIYQISMSIEMPPLRYGKSNKASWAQKQSIEGISRQENTSNGCSSSRDTSPGP